jgi:hypothetical protein
MPKPDETRSETRQQLAAATPPPPCEIETAADIGWERRLAAARARVVGETVAYRCIATPRGWIIKAVTEYDLRVRV